MKTIVEKARETPIAHEVDVLVLGGGPAGFGAALSAGREGARVMLMEQSGEIGGVATSGLMSHWTGATKGGLFAETIAATSKAYTPLDLDYFPLINHEYLKNWMIDQLEQANVDIHLYTHAVEPIMEGNRIVGVLSESKEGRTATLAKVVVDATGDGDIAAKTGAAFIKGRETDGTMQPMTLMLQIAGVDRSQITYPTEFEKDWILPQGSLQALARKHLAPPAGHVLIYPTVYPNNVILNMTNCIDVDGTVAADLTKAHIQCRKQIPEIMQFLKAYVPGFQEAYVIKTASAIGVRETRHFKGVETLTEQDIVEARVFDNWAVTQAHFNFDVHNMSGAGIDATGKQDQFHQSKGYTIPYGCFVPEAVDGLLLAGRCISGTHMAHSNYRAMPICLNMGQSVGIAAALCIRKEVLPRDLPIRDLQKRLMQLGVTPQ